MGVRPGRVELHIDELVLHGFDPTDHYRIGETVERELARLFSERGVPPSLAQDREILDLRGGTFEASPGAGTETVGTRVARAVYEGFAW